MVSVDDILLSTFLEVVEGSINGEVGAEWDMGTFQKDAGYGQIDTRIVDTKGYGMESNSKSKD